MAGRIWTTRGVGTLPYGGLHWIKEGSLQDPGRLVEL